MENEDKKKIALYIPNLTLDGSGGAETYGLGIAEALSAEYDVTIFVRKNAAVNVDTEYEKYGSKRFDTRFVRFISIGPKHPRLRVISQFQLRPMIKEIESSFDLLINCTQGELNGSTKIPSIHIIHFPERPAATIFPKNFGSIIDRNYLNSYNLFLANSDFTRKWFELYWRRECSVLNPPSRLDDYEVDFLAKENIILSVGRIVPDKKILEMIEAFKKFINEQKNDYKFVIVGNTRSKYSEYAEQVKAQTKGYPIELRSNVNQKELIDWYRKAKIYWHAKGYGVADDDPFNMEHFGMSTVEAMSFGCVPVVINRGGQVEIVDDGINGKRWNTLEELAMYTSRIISDEKKMKELSDNARVKARFYRMDCFTKRLLEYIKEYMH